MESLAGLLLLIIAIPSSAYVDAGERVPVPGLAPQELGIPESDFSLAKIWLDGAYGRPANNLARDEWIKQKELAGRILALGPHRWVRAMMAVSLSQSDPHLPFNYVGIQYDPEFQDDVRDLTRALGRHLCDWLKVAPANHPYPFGLRAIFGLLRNPQPDDIGLLDEIEHTIQSRLDLVSENSNNGTLPPEQARRSWQRTLDEFKTDRAENEKIARIWGPLQPTTSGSVWDQFSVYANSHWIIGEGVAFDLKPAEISRLREEGRLYDPDDLPPLAPVDDRTWIVVSSLIIAAVLVGLFLGRQRLRRKFEQ